MSDFKLNRKVCSAHAKEESPDYKTFYGKMNWKERLLVAAYLNSVAYRYDPDNPPAMNKNHFSAKSLTA
jgi:hypothetical protein